MQLDFDPDVITYERLLGVFFASHDASRRSSSRQYMSAIFFHSVEQEHAAQAAKAKEELRLGRAVETQILRAEVFYPAEDYHQKYALQADSALLTEYRRMYPDFAGLVDSTSATRVNAYLYGCGDAEQLRRELDSLGLSEEGRKRLIDRVE